MKKPLMLALAAASVMMLALPAVASATLKTWNMDWRSGDHTSPLTFTIQGTTVPRLKIHTGDFVECSTVSGSGAYTTTMAGVIKLVFTGCGIPDIGLSCKSGGTNGVIETTVLTFHNIYSNLNGKEGPAVLITPNGTHFASFACTLFGFGAHVKVAGTGVIGTVENCGTGTVSGTNKSFGINFQAAAAGTQTHTTAVGTPGTWDLTWSRNGAAPVTASLEGTDDLVIAAADQPNATC